MRQTFYNGTIVKGSNDIINNGYITISDGQIVDIGTNYVKKIDGTSIDLKGKWVLPGLINTHGHVGSTLLRGYGDDLPLDEWLKTKMWPMEAKFTEETVISAVQLAMVEMIKSGTTTFLEMYHLHLDTVAQLVDKAGMRAVITRGMIGLCSTKEQEEKLREACALNDRLQNSANGRITTMFAPHAPYTCPPNFLELIAMEAKSRRLPIHIHLSETAKEVEEHVKKYGIRPVVHLAQLGVFDVPTLCAHVVHVTDDELDVLAQYDVAVSHNPISNLKLGSGIANVPKMLKKNINVAIGTDSVASNNNLDMFQEMRMAALIHKGNQQNSTLVSANQAVEMATINGAKALQLQQIGQLEIGYDADFITINPNGAHLQPKEQVLSHIVYSASGSDVCDVYVKGTCLLKDRQCQTLDEEKIIFSANKAFQKIH